MAENTITYITKQCNLPIQMSCSITYENINNEIILYLAVSAWCKINLFKQSTAPNCRFCVVILILTVAVFLHSRKSQEFSQHNYAQTDTKNVLYTYIKDTLL